MSLQVSSYYIYLIDLLVLMRHKRYKGAEHCYAKDRRWDKEEIKITTRNLQEALGNNPSLKLDYITLSIMLLLEDNLATNSLISFWRSGNPLKGFSRFELVILGLNCLLPLHRVRWLHHLAIYCQLFRENHIGMWLKGWENYFRSWLIIR